MIFSTVTVELPASSLWASGLNADWYIMMLLRLLAVFLLVALNAFFVAAEFAIVKVRSTQLNLRASAGDKRAKTAQYIVRHINPFLNTTQVGITLASLGLGWIGEPIFAAILEPFMGFLGIVSPALKHSIAFAVGFSIITFLHIVLGECTPKTLAIFKPLESTLFIARPLRFFYIILYPVIWFLNETSIWMIKKLGLQAIDETDHPHSEEELKILLSGDNRQLLAGRNIVLNALDLKNRIAREVMTPRREITWLSDQYTINECIDIAEATKYSRFPLCQKGDLDRILGVVHIKDLYAMRHKIHSASQLGAALKKSLFVPGTARLEKLLFRLMDSKNHFATVVDEYGGTIGVVTQENILEELVGQIQDEFDQEQHLIQNRGEDVWVLAGHLPIHQLEAMIGQSCNMENVTTVGGLVTQLLSSFPTPGEFVKLGDWTLTVEKTKDRRAETLVLERVNKDNKKT